LLFKSPQTHIQNKKPHNKKIQAEFRDDFGQSWASWAEFRANDQGEVDLETAKPIDGTYHDPDGMGLFWSMKLRTNENVQSVPFVNTVTKSLKPLSIEWTAKCQGETIATAVSERKFLADEVKRIDLREEGLTATLFVPSVNRQGPAVIILGGSGGSFGWSHQVAALLASHGCIAIAIAYFDWQGEDNLPNQLVEIPLELIGKAVERLLPLSNDLSGLAIIGYSKGAEFADGFEVGYTNFKIGVMLRQAREAAGLTQEEVARQLNTTKSAISRIENHAYVRYFNDHCHIRYFLASLNSSDVGLMNAEHVTKLFLR
jgi:hypothetical protein